jgi:hypothetical protein
MSSESGSSSSGLAASLLHHLPPAHSPLLAQSLFSVLVSLQQKKTTNKQLFICQVPTFAHKNVT